MHLVLVEPEIPQNTGNIARTCVLTGTPLHLVEPLGFSIDDRQVRRSGLDYWKYLDLKVQGSFESLLKENSAARFISYSTRGKDYYHQFEYLAGDFLVFGSETRGLDEAIIKKTGITLRIPMLDQVPRSLNLGNAVALVLYEALRQQGFPRMV